MDVQRVEVGRDRRNSIRLVPAVADWRDTPFRRVSIFGLRVRGCVVT